MRIPLIVSILLTTVTTYAQTTAFTYQGRLFDQGTAANGNYDLQFSVFDAATVGNQLGTSLTNSTVAVSNGLFTVNLDFGPGAFDGSARWLEIAARTNGSSGSFTTLAPRQAITSTPYAITAANVNTSNLVATLSSSTNLNLNGTFGLSGSNSVFRLNDHPLYLGGAGDNSSGLVYSDTVNQNFGSDFQAGPVLFGGSGGTLGTTFFGDEISLTWSFNTVSVPGIFNAAQANINALSVGPSSSLDLEVFSTNILNTWFVGDSPTGTWLDLGNISTGGKDWLMISTAAGNGEGAGKLLFQPGTAPFSASGIYDLTLDPTGKVGIGTASPTAPLHVFSTSFPTALIDSSSPVGSWLEFNNSSGGGFWAIIDTATNNGEGAQKLAFATPVGEPLVLTTNKVGINTANPTTTLEVNGNATIDTNAVVQGMLGVGTSNPTAVLDTFSPGAPSALFDGSWNAGTWVEIRNSAGGETWSLISTATNNGEGAKKLLVQGSSGSNTLVLSDGKLGIDTAFPSTALEVNGDATFDGKLTVTNGATGVRIWGAGGAGAKATLDLSSYNPGANLPSARLQVTDDGNDSSFWDFYCKAPGPIGNNLVSVMHIGETGNVIIAGALTQNSDRNVKTNFDSVNVMDVLEKVASLPISTWQYKTDPSQKHLGPMAQDFYAAFQVGPDEKHITTVDESGVALAAIQGLNQKVDQLQNENTQLRQQNEQLARQMAVIAAELKSLDTRK